VDPNTTSVTPVYETAASTLVFQDVAAAPKLASADKPANKFRILVTTAPRAPGAAASN